MGIKKIDYYAGALLSHLIKHRITPAIFDSSDHSKIVTFETNEGKYNLFVKYSSKPVRQIEDYSRWDISFTQSEYETITNYIKEGYKNSVVIVCSTESLTQTEISVIDVNKAKKCMGNDSVNKNRRISVRLNKNSRYLRVYGTAVDYKDAFQIKRNLDKHFD